jgi:ribosomal protein S12 methylthiotransferase accessory factor
MHSSDSRLRRKDADAQATIARARESLSRIGVWLYEASWCSLDRFAHSVRVCDAAWPDDAAVGANGKGATRELALASAYAEYLERLQNLFLEPFNTNYGLMPPLLELPDARTLTVGELFERHPGTMAHLLPPADAAACADIELVCLPFCDVADGRMEYLPRKLLNWACSSNGMAAGNTPEEALTASICEVFERYASRRTWHERLVLPEIPLADLQSSHAAAQIDGIAAHGMRVLIRDASLGMGLPVVAVAVLDQGSARFQVKFGAAATLALAVERCITELMQGRPSPEHIALYPVQWESDPAMAGEAARQRAYQDWRRDGSGPFPTSILAARGKPRHPEHFEQAFEGNRATLHRMRQRVEAMGCRLLVRNASFLGFPSYRVYIPGLSEIHSVADAERLELLSRGWERTGRTLLRLGTASEEELRRLLDDLERYRRDPRFSSVAILENIVSIVVGPTSPFRALYDIDYLMTVLSLRLGEPARAARHLAAYVRQFQRGSEMMVSPYLSCASQWLDGVADGRPEAEWHALLASCYGEALLEKVKADLGNPATILDHSVLPACGDCAPCPARNDCRYPIWRATAERMKAELTAHPIDQGQVRALFGPS